MKYKLILILVIILSANIVFSTQTKVDPENIMGIINKGDDFVLKDISYNNLIYVMDTMRQNYQGAIPFGKRNKVLNSVLKGLLNKDPRIVLICIDIIKYFKVDHLMEPEVKLAYRNYVLKKKSHRVGKYRDHYAYIDMSGKKVTKSISFELIKLYRFVLRDKLMNIVLKKNPYLFKIISKNHFNVLYFRIENESDEDIPLKSFGKKKFFLPEQIERIIYGLDNPNYSIKRTCANYLIRYYNTNLYNIDIHTRNVILKALKTAYDNDIIPKPKLRRIGQDD